ncbi:MAG: hypothetical protein PHV34_08780 [Verrucomicrobiae bacterium]|nr:hypothetical protein [Verrucomicrobiae bacterium]
MDIIPPNVCRPIVRDRRIPSSTQEELDNPETHGERHHQIVKITVALTARGFAPKEIFGLLRPNYDADGPNPVPDEEIWAVIEGIAKYDLSPNPSSDNKLQRSKLPRIAPDEAVRNIRKFIGEFKCVEDEVRERSPCRVDGDPMGQAVTFLRELFKPDEWINLVWHFRVGPDGRPCPKYGIVRRRAEWTLGMERRNGVPQGDAGTWVRINPLDGRGIANSNVANFRYAMVEFDSIPLDLQLAFLARVKLPIAAIITSGGKSLHAWLRVDAKDLNLYQAKVSDIYRYLVPFGIDPANRNPSRLSRLPGARRTIGATGDGLQRLLYLNLNPSWKPIA